MASVAVADLGQEALGLRVELDGEVAVAALLVGERTVEEGADVCRG